MPIQKSLLTSILAVGLGAGCSSKQSTPYPFPEAGVKKMRDAVVEIRGYGVDRCAGAFVKPGIIVTASHCVFSNLNIEFSRPTNQERFYEADVIYHSPIEDISILRSRDFVSSTYLEIEPDLAQIKPNETVATMGHPVKIEKFSDALVLTEAHRYRLSTGKTIGIDDNKLAAVIQIYPGNSGGPLIGESGKVIGVTSALGIETSTFNLIGLFSSGNGLDQVREKTEAPDITAAPPLPWTRAESTLYSNFGMGIRNARYSEMPWIPTLSLGIDFAGRFDLAVGTSPFFGDEFEWYYERFRVYQRFGTGLSSFRVGAGIVCQQTSFFNSTPSNMSSCAPEISLGAPHLDLGFQFGGSGDQFIKIMFEIRVMRWLSSLGY